MNSGEAQDFRALLQKLDCKVTVTWLEEMRLGRPVYDFLVRSLRSETLTQHQQANILHALFRLRSHDSDDHVFSILIKFASHQEERVRTEAVKLIIGMVKMHRYQAPFFSDEIQRHIADALEMGLGHDTANLARAFLRGDATW